MVLLRTLSKPSFCSDFLQDGRNSTGFLDTHPRLNDPNVLFGFQPLGSSAADVQQDAIVRFDFALLERLHQAHGRNSSPGVMMSMPSTDSIDETYSQQRHLLFQRCTFARSRPSKCHERHRPARMLDLVHQIIRVHLNVVRREIVLNQMVTAGLPSVVNRAMLDVL